MNPNRPLQLAKPRSAALAVPGHDPWHVSLGDPAMAAMTDFHERSPVTVGAYAPIDAALDHMKHAGVRAALVVAEPQGQVVGLITAYDILGEKPMRHLQSIGCTHSTCSRDDVKVIDIMERVEAWQVLYMKDVEAATVGHLVDLFKTSGLTHVVVMQTAANGSEQLRGMFSAAKLCRLVGIASLAPAALPAHSEPAAPPPANRGRRAGDIPRLEAWQRFSDPARPLAAGR